MATKNSSSGDSKAEPASRYEARRVGDAIYDRVVAHTDRDGRNLSGIFSVLPSKKDYADYYILIKQPMALDIIRQKLNVTPTGPDWQPPKRKGPQPKKSPEKDGFTQQGYLNVDEVFGDFELMWNNAKTYNAEESLVYKDAKALQRVTKKTVAELINRHATSPPGPEGDDRSATGADDRPSKKRRMSGSTPASESQEPPKTLRQSLDSVIEKLDGVFSTSGDGSRAMQHFDELPPKTVYPDYYEFIKKPMSLSMIKSKIAAGSYSSIGDWKTDMETMFDNALLYNQDDSVIYRDAVKLKDEVAKSAAAMSAPAPANGGGLRLKLSLGKAASTATSATPAAATAAPAPTAATSEPKTKKSKKSKSTEAASSNQPSDASELLPLPTGAISKAVVDKLDDYPEDRQVAWAKSLPNGATLYLRKMLEEKKASRPALVKNGPPIIPTPRGIVLPSNQRAPPRPSEEKPLVRYMTIAYEDQTEKARPVVTSIKLHVSREISSHIVQVPSSVRQLEVKAFLEEGFLNLNPIQTSDPSAEGSPKEGEKQIETKSLADSLSYAPLPELRLRIDSVSTPGILTYRQATDKLGENPAKRPNGCKWSFKLDSTQPMTPIELFAFRPREQIPNGREAVSETTKIYVNRQ